MVPSVARRVNVLQVYVLQLLEHHTGVSLACQVSGQLSTKMRIVFSLHRGVSELQVRPEGLQGVLVMMQYAAPAVAAPAQNI